MRQAIIENGIVVNIVLVSVGEACPDEVAIGWIYDGTDYAPPVVSEPAPEPLPPLTARQFRLGLVYGGILPSQIDAAISAIEDEAARAVAQIEWQHAAQFERSHPLIEQVGSALGLTSVMIDEMWVSAPSL